MNRIKRKQFLKRKIHVSDGWFQTMTFAAGEDEQQLQAHLLIYLKGFFLFKLWDKLLYVIQWKR